MGTTTSDRRPGVERLGIAAVLLLVAAAGGSGIEGVDWRLVELGGRAVEVAKPEQRPTLRLDAAERHAAGTGGCNRFGGGYQLDGAKLRFAELASTMMACEHGMETEAAYHAALAKVRGWRIAGERLELLDEAGGALAAFEPAPAPTP
jgi:heat shock protein HslJ